MRCILIDDEPRALDLLRGYVEKTPLELIGEFRDPLDAITFLNDHQVDLIFLDINMPNLNGMQFNEVLERKPLIIFTTAYSQYALESYTQNAVDYLLKPFEFARFLSAVNKAIERSKVFEYERSQPGVQDHDKESFYIKSGTSLHKINLVEILFVEKLGRKLIFHKEHERIESRMNMKDIFNLIPEASFVQVHKSFVVSISKIDTIENQYLFIRDHKIPIGASHKKVLLARINTHSK